MQLIYCLRSGLSNYRRNEDLHNSVVKKLVNSI